MTILSEARGLFDEWIAAVTQALESGLGRYARRPLIVLSGQSADVLTARLKSAPKDTALRDISLDRKSVV